MHKLKIKNPFNKVKPLEKLMFTKHMYIMIKSGVPISETLQTLAEHTKSKYFKSVLLQVYEDVQSGKSLHVALGRFPDTFDKFYVSLVKVSEESGTLETTLEFLADQLAKDYELRKKIKGAMFYPTLILIATFGIGGFISIVILPQFVDFFNSLNAELPLSTRMLMVFAGVMKDHGILIFTLTGLFFIFIKWFLNTRHVKPRWHKIQLVMPVFGKLIRYTQLARMCRNLATLLNSGVPATKALETTADTMTNLTFNKDLHEVEDALVQGRNISDSMEDGDYKEIPSMIPRMIKVGERTGNLSEVLEYMSEFYETEIDHMTKNMSSIIEPFLLIGMGIMVGFIAIAIIGPIYQITGSIN